MYNNNSIGDGSLCTELIDVFSCFIIFQVFRFTMGTKSIQDHFMCRSMPIFQNITLFKSHEFVKTRKHSKGNQKLYRYIPLTQNHEIWQDYMSYLGQVKKKNLNCKVVRYITKKIALRLPKYFENLSRAVIWCGSKVGRSSLVFLFMRSTSTCNFQL